MSTEDRSPIEEDAFAAERSRIERFYTEKFLPANAWSTLKHGPYLYLRQRQRRIREALLECGLDTTPKLRELDILDVGSGGGTNLAWLVELGVDPSRCTGIDLVEQRVATARARQPNIRWLAGDIVKTDVGGPFDLVFLVAVLSSVGNAAMKRAIVDRCFELLRPGGVFFFYDLMTRREDPGTKDLKKLTYEEVHEYVGGRAVRWYRRDLLEYKLADRITARLGVTAAELLQATRLFNSDASFAYVRA